MKLKLTTLGAILTLALFLAAVTAVGVSIRTTQGIDDMTHAWEGFSAESSREMELLQRLNRAIGYGGMIHQFKNYVLRQEPTRAEKAARHIDEALKIIKAYRAIGHSMGEVNALDAIESTVRAYKAALAKAVVMTTAGNTSVQIDRVVKIDDGPALAALTVLTESFVQSARESTEMIERTADRTTDVARTGAVVVAVSLLVVVAVLAWFMTMRLGRPLRRMTAAMERLARGDVSVSIPAVGRKDEIGEMAAAVSVFRDNINRIRNMEADARGLVQSIASTAGQVQGAVNAQASSASEQAASVTQTSTSLEQIRETATHTMDRASSLGQSAARTVSEGESGLAAMADGIAAVRSIRDKVEAIAGTMVTLSAQNHRVGEITASVNNLAQQSKMLAINASIEAAKAGEAGKGFAVVAEEMGNLADQSEEATVQVRAVLDEIQAATEKAVLATEEGTKQADVGVRLIQDAGVGIEELNKVIGHTVTETSRIIDAVRQQTAGIQQVSAAVNEINGTTRQFATTSSQISDAMEKLIGEVDDLTRTRQA